ncbi:MAG: RdgB/HAM1 family non-canonical purine NTP pyrophosphatase [Planctomycetota bacterium]
MHRKTLVLGTGNKHKAVEIAPLLNDGSLRLDVRAAGTYGEFDPVEDGETLEENAIIKARAAMALSNEWSIADDTGLFVDALNGRPGIYAARYAGIGCSFADNVRKMLGELECFPPDRRTATFTCVIALCRPGFDPVTFRGDCRGRITLRPSGEGGFGYDPIFEVDGLGKTFAHMTVEEKNTISHRAIAVKKCGAALAALLVGAK